MRKLLFLLTVFTAFTICAQESVYFEKDSLQDMNRWTFRASFNTVDSNGNGSGNPFNNFFSLDEEAYHGVPIKLDLEYRFSELFAFELAGSLNKWKAGEGNIDGILLTEDQNYFAVDAGVKIYYDEAFNWFSSMDWIELYFTGGLGYFKINEGGISANFGTGATFWVSDHLGININATAKWAVDSKPAIYDTNHTQYGIGLAYRFQDPDKDNDGVYDYNDYCPNLAGSKERNGCPDDGTTTVNKETVVSDYDSDNDGVKDSADKCPTIAGEPSNNGCPVKDSDKDGIIDSVDNCPTIYGVASNNGCPAAIIDSDKDGVIDSADNCPTIYGSPSNNGCPERRVATAPVTTTETFTSMVRRVEFNTGNYNFTQEAYAALQTIVAYMKENPYSSYIIEGHTDSVGSYTNNRRLSKTRANAVKNYLVDNGIPEEILTTVGYGESRPIESNLTSEGKARNRRIEIIETK